MRDGDLELRRFEHADAPAVEALFGEPEVRRWWADGDYDRDGGWVAEVDGRFAGWVQYVEEPYPWYPSVALDIALTSDLHGRGYGRRALKLAIEHFVAKGHHRFTIDPDPANERAVRCYEAVGFKPVGILRKCERRDEAWHDALLMDLLASEFIDG